MRQLPFPWSGRPVMGECEGQKGSAGLSSSATGERTTVPLSGHNTLDPDALDDAHLTWWPDAMREDSG